MVMVRVQNGEIFAALPQVSKWSPLFRRNSPEYIIRDMIRIRYWGWGQGPGARLPGHPCPLRVICWSQGGIRNPYWVSVEETSIVFLPSITLFQDLPIGFLDDVYDWMKVFSERLDDVEELVTYNRIWRARTVGICPVTLDNALAWGMRWSNRRYLD